MKLAIYVSIIIIPLILIFLFFMQGNTTATLIPREVLFGNPDKASVTISPDGKRIGYLSAKDGILNVYIADRNDPANGVPITDDKTRGIRSYSWAYDNKHILYMQDKNGDEDWHIYKVNIETSKVQDLTPFKNTTSMIISVSENIPDSIVIAVNNRDPRYFDLYEADINSGRLKLLYENKAELTEQIVSDDNGQYRLSFATKIKEDGSKTILKVSNDMKLEPFLEVPLEDVRSTNILGFGATSNIVYLLSSIDRNTNALIEYSQINNISTVLHHDSQTDIDDVLFKPKKKYAQIVYNEFLKITKSILDDEIKEDIDYLENFNKEALLNICSRDLNDKYWIIGYMSDKRPYEYFLYNRQSKKLKFLFTNRKALEQYSLAPMWPVIIKSHDGLDLISYLTVPIDSLNKDDKSFVPSKTIPLILNVHGGPKGIRDSWGLDNAHQWFANRGYAVLSVNYRASGGLGKKFMNSGDGQWSKKMQSDLLDAVQWAIDNNITTKDKVAIYGGSYGGYAALVGVTFTPDVFACAVDIVGPSNLITLMKSVPAYWAPFYKQLMKTIGGDPDKEEGREFLRSISPITYVENIKRPLLIAQGANDPRVKQAESDQIVSSMKEHNIPVIYLLYGDEGHGFARPENKMSFYAVTEQFLAKHLEGKAEPIGEAFKGSSIKILEGKKEYLNQ